MAKKETISTEVIEVNGYQLYKIHNEVENLISSYINPETGEINAVANAHLNTLSLRREDAIHGITLSHLQNEAKADAVEKEIQRLEDLKTSISRRAEAAKRILENELQDGESFEFENCKISWKKNPVSVEADPDLNLDDLEFAYPDLVSTKQTKSLIKKEAKAVLESGKEIAGIRLITDKKSLQIK